MNRLTSIALAALFAGSLTMLGCNTARGIGQDTYAAWNAITGELDRAGEPAPESGYYATDERWVEDDEYWVEEPFDREPDWE